jgi:hypothetical protein
MANRRMFSKQITNSDAFMDMPISSQLLYFHLNMEADDDGFVSNPKRIIRAVGSSEDDLKILIGKRFILSFPSGIIVIKHWRMHNYIQSDRYKESQYLEEKKSLIVKENGSYTECIQNVSTLDTQVRIGKDRLVKDSKDEEVVDAPTQIVWKTEEWANERSEHYFKEVNETIHKKYFLLEIQKFINYWTEKNPGGKKERWQMQKVFDPNRRLATWMSRFLENKKSDTQSTGINKI